jgi:hypothetical protein
LIESISKKLVGKIAAKKGILEIVAGDGGHLMVTDIPFGQALQLLAVAYLASVVVLMAVSYICWVAIETLEDSRRL